MLSEDAMVRSGYRRHLSLQACLQVEALRAGTRHLLANAVEIRTAAATFEVAMMNCPITAAVMFDMDHGPQRTNGRQTSSEFGIETAKESAIRGSGQQ
jgi:hypothetical protein